MQYTEKFIEIDAPLERVFDLFSNFENFPRWMRNIKDVHYSGRHFTRWTARAPFGSEVEWEAETTLYQPDHKIAWRSVRGDVDTEGEVIFEETRRGTTRMHVILGYDPPAGRLGAMVASLFGKDPEKQLEDDLERFAAVAEGRRPVGPYREASSRREEEDYPPHYLRSARDEGRSHRSTERSYDDDARVVRREQMDGRRSFEEELRAARRSQLESQRRYMETGARDHHRRYTERDEQIRREALRERREERPQRPSHPRREEHEARHEERREEPRHRYAMTPRERARERRQLDYDYPEKAFSRGVDKLMDDPPSNRWRR